MVRNSRWKLAWLLLLAVLLAGCAAAGGKEAAPSPGPAGAEKPDAELLRLLPAAADYQWLYNGFAEYGHTMRLRQVDKVADAYRYIIDGEVHDMSAGEADGDFSLSIVYEIRDGIWVQESSGEKLLDSDFGRIELLRAPVQTGQAWTQTVRDKDGAGRELDCRVTAVQEEGGRKVYLVSYQEKNGAYYEKREIAEGIGVVAFEKLWRLPDGAFPIGYRINYGSSGYLNRLELEAYLPPLGQELRYFGLAEYGHQGKLERVSGDDGGAVYRFAGTFVDGSGLDGDFTVLYKIDYRSGTVTEQAESNTRTQRPEINSRLHDPVILQTPLAAGSQWRCPVTLNGQAREMRAEIISVVSPPIRLPVSNSVPVVTVRYTVGDVPGYFRNVYVEERRFQKGRGMIGFSALQPGDLGLDAAAAGDPKQLEEAYLNHYFGYGLALEL